LEQFHRWLDDKIERFTLESDKIRPRVSSDFVPNTESIDSAGRTPLYVAAQYGNVELTKSLLEMGAVVDSRVPNFNMTPLYAAAQNDHQDVVMVLIAAGADVDSVNLLEESPLYVAARNGHQAVVQSLIAAGADVNSKDESQISPLHIAALRGHKVVRLLLQLSAGLDMTDREKVMTVVEELLFPSGHTQKMPTRILIYSLLHQW
jgi:ankyrin repeat protein